MKGKKREGGERKGGEAMLHGVRSKNQETGPSGPVEDALERIGRGKRTENRKKGKILAHGEKMVKTQQQFRVPSEEEHSEGCGGPPHEFCREKGMDGKTYLRSKERRNGKGNPALTANVGETASRQAL